MHVDPAITELELESHRIVQLICSEAVAAEEIERRIARLRDRAASVFPDRPDVFDRTYGRRFQRLRTRFRPAPGLF
jgi:hypothetical protein